MVRISFVAMAGRVLPRALAERLRPLASAIDATLAGSDDRSQSRRVALVAFATRVVSAVIVLASQVMMARWMGEHEYGVFVVVWVAAVIVGGLSCFGFQLSVVRFIPEYLERKKDGLLRGIILGARAYGLADVHLPRADRRSRPRAPRRPDRQLLRDAVLSRGDLPADAGDRRDSGRRSARLQLGRSGALADLSSCGRWRSSSSCGWPSRSGGRPTRSPRWLRRSWPPTPSPPSRRWRSAAG